MHNQNKTAKNYLEVINELNHKIRNYENAASKNIHYSIKDNHNEKSNEGNNYSILINEDISEVIEYLEKKIPHKNKISKHLKFSNKYPYRFTGKKSDLSHSEKSGLSDLVHQSYESLHLNEIYKIKDMIM